MGLIKGSSAVCPKSSHCSRWARHYMKFCLCNAKDGASLTLGLISVVSWGVAEIPQIITTYKEKSTEGLSVPFLMTWIIGDLFNLVGCILEPATLPTQYYTALLYTATTAILTGQTIYYNHMYPQLKWKKIPVHFKDDNSTDENAIYAKKRGESMNGKERLQGYQNQNKPSNFERLHHSSSPIPVGSTILPHSGAHRGDLYYMSARSLSRSRTPPFASLLLHQQGSDGSSDTSLLHGDSTKEPLLSGMHSAPPPSTKSLLCVVSGMMFLLAGYEIHFLPNAWFPGLLREPAQAIVLPIRRRLLQDVLELSPVGEPSAVGTYLGWAMAAIYMGGRLPQIGLNIRRGDVEGLNPFMFVFALIGNLTYVASILFRSLEWSKIEPNLPWLVDAGGCVILDCLILLQFVYFKWKKCKMHASDAGHYFTA